MSIQHLIQQQNFNSNDDDTHQIENKKRWRRRNWMAAKATVAGRRMIYAMHICIWTVWRCELFTCLWKLIDYGGVFCMLFTSDHNLSLVFVISIEFELQFRKQAIAIASEAEKFHNCSKKPQTMYTLDDRLKLKLNATGKMLRGKKPELEISKTK